MGNENEVVVVGSTNWDICMYLPHLPSPGETVGGGRLKGNLGGKGANQAVACHLAGASVNFVSALGGDTTAETIMTQFDEIGLDNTHLVQIKDCDTGTACIFIDKSAENCIGLTAGANNRLTPELVNSYCDLISSAKVVLLQLEIPLKTVIKVAKIAHEAGALVILNPAPAKELPDELLKIVDVLTPNIGEAEQLAKSSATSNSEVQVPQTNKLNAIANSLLKKGVRHVIVTQGKEGASLFEPDKSPQHFHAPKVNAIDTTGAGDVFNGVLCAGLAQELSIEKAIEKAIIGAAISVSREGAIPSVPTEEEISTFPAP